ncbi:MAG: Glutamate-ammonia-ligase adenylyltransferase [uncultured Sphingomonadaceae bacterium]|uniref:Glutamate-ammonia-ligase adenylyltransferase n=1 Tax=uncultured Sphingomonadaceae bacterium TaxID=169976 RepID=A0A6J4TDC0_9SPHN|nr:MAG: Glutamate-ammonia-ligase adenylyltransferase [uncultured Sphingomonadaceae bacterium]
MRLPSLRAGKELARDRGVKDTVALADALSRARAYAPFLRLAAEREAPLVDLLFAEGLAPALAATEAIDLALPLADGLRVARRRLSLVLALGDLAGLLPLEAVVARLSGFADRALDLTIRAAIAERAPDAEPAGFAAIALGKHGSRELNFSSDIDPILLYDPATLPRRPRDGAVDAAVRIARRVVELLSANTAQGFVFRVDLRLRPSPEATPIALPVDAAIGHYESAALPWERAAFVRARAAAGDLGLGERFLRAVQPFVWRRSLDFGAVGELRAISRRVRAHHGEAPLGPGYDLKRGRGGIREVEFFAQIHQLIHGGRDASLREPATLPALAALARAGHVGEGEAAALAAAYRVLRTVEHRLQMVDDRQTHGLPETPDALDDVARLHGLSGRDALLDLLRPHVLAVAAAFDALIETGGERLPHTADALDAALLAAGFPDPAAVRARVEGWRSGNARALRSAAAQDALEAMLPALLPAFARAPDPGRAVNRFDALVARLPSGVNLFRLLEARPALAELLSAVLAHAPALAEALADHPELLDGLLDASAFLPAPPVSELAAEFARGGEGGYGELLDAVRRRVNERRFAVGVQLIAGRADPLDAAAAYARIAEAAVDVVARAAAGEFARAHGRVPGAELLILGYGRLGGAALTHASDLDLVFLFTGDFGDRSDGPKPLGATDYHNRLARRVAGALSLPTAAGPLYDVDTRLRPSGAQGLLAVSVDSFLAYQRDEAWTWEHMALTRARPVFGPADARAVVEEGIAAVLARPRDDAKLTADVVAMRAEMAAHKLPVGSLDVKLGPGGLVDLEFAVHLLQLRYCEAFDFRLGEAVRVLAAARLLPPDAPAWHDLLTRLLVMLRLIAPAGDDPAEASRPLVARACGAADWDALLAMHRAARQGVGDIWDMVARGREGEWS